MNKVLVCFFAITLCLPVHKISGQDVDELKKKLKLKRQLLKIQEVDLRKSYKIQKPTFRRFGRNMKDIVFDFDSKKFIHEKNMTDTLDNPPYEINELDGINIKIRNVNPFLYSVDLYELQGDQISNEKLLEVKQTNNLSLKIEPIKEFEFNLPQNSLADTGCDSTNFEDLISKRMIAVELQLLADDLGSSIANEEDNIEMLNYAIKNKIDTQSFATADETAIKRYQYELASKIRILKNLKLDLAKIQKRLKDESLDSLQLDKAISTERKKLKQSCAGAVARKLHFELQDMTKQLKQDMNRINQYIFLHNQVVKVVKMRVNSAAELKDMVDSLFTTMSVGTWRQLPAIYFSDHSKVLVDFDNVIRILNDLQIKDSANHSQYKIALASINVSYEGYKSFDYSKLVSELLQVVKFVDERNFELNYQTLSISENADFVKYRIEFKPTNNGDIQETQSPFNLDIAFLINEGLKVDISTGIILDFNLANPGYYFQKFSSTQNGQTFDSVRVKKSSNLSNITPSVNLMLNAYKRSSLNFKPGFSIGFGVSSDIRFRLYAGPSLIVGRKERVMISSGVAFGAITRNADGYDEGKTFADTASLPAQVPIVQDTFKFGWYFGVGFNLTGKDTRGFIEKIKFR